MEKMRKSTKLILVVLIILFQVTLSSKTLNKIKSCSQVHSKELNTYKNSCPNYTFGFKGSCLSQFGMTNLSTDTVQSNFKTVASSLSFINEILFKMTTSFDLCMGDYDGKTFSTSNQLSYMNCNNIFLDTNYNYGVFAFNVPEIPACLIDPLGSTDVAVCGIFDQCGTIAVVANGNVGKCVAQLVPAGGISQLVKATQEFSNSAAFGISINKRFTLSFNLIYADGTNIQNKTVTTYGHLLLYVMFTLPADFKIFNFKLNDIIGINTYASFQVDFGNSANLIESTFDKIKSGHFLNQQDILDSVYNLSAEVSFSVSGNVVIQLGNLTRGILPYLYFNIGMVNVLLSTGGSGNASGMKAGFYMYLYDGNFIRPFQIVNIIYGQFTAILQLFDVKLPAFQLNSALTFGVFIQSDSAGFQFTIPGLTSQCLFQYSSGIATCSFNSISFSIMIIDKEWVIKTAKYLFDKAGEVVKKITQSTINFANDAKDFIASKSTDLETGLVRNTQIAVDAVKDAAKKAGDAITQTAQQAGDAIKQTAQQAGDSISNVFKSSAW
jgi:hypothetical protein